MVTGLPARRGVCGDDERQATLVDFRGSNLSDAGSIPAISTLQKPSQALGFCVIKSAMKKILLIGLILLISACQGAQSAPPTEPAPTQTPPPTPMPASPTPDIPPTAAPSPTPEPPPLYFTEEFNEVSSYWSILQTGGLTEPSFAYENSALRIDIPSPDTWSIGIHSAHTYSNVFLRARASASPTGAIGLICRYDEETGWYEFNAASDGTYNALYGRWLTEGVAQYIPLVSDRSVHLSSGTLNYELGLSCQDNFILLYVNDTLIRRVEVTNFGLIEGRIGITASSLREAPVTALFEWVRIGME